MGETKAYRDWWERRDGIDLWSVPHFLFGILMGISPYFFPLSIHAAFVLMIVISIVWECLEIIRGIRESVINKILDVTFHVFGFLLISTLFTQHPQGLLMLLPFSISTLIAYLGMNFLGWLAYRRRKRVAR